MRSGEIVLVSGRTVKLLSLRQWAVYAGLLEGLPTRSMNDEAIKRVRQEACKRTGHEPFVIEPKQQRIEISRPYPFGEPATLPAVGCVGDFISGNIADLEQTLLTIIWFQDEFGFPPTDDAMSALVAIDWDKLARVEPV